MAELIAAIPVGLALVHPFDLRIVAANPAMGTALGGSPEALLGGRVTQVLPQEHPLADPTHYRGFGIEEGLQPLLYQRFRPIETDTNRHLVGLGIGLFLVRQVLGAHRGQIQIESHPSAGTTATLEVPR